MVIGVSGCYGWLETYWPGQTGMAGWEEGITRKGPGGHNEHDECVQFWMNRQSSAPTPPQPVCPRTGVNPHPLPSAHPQPCVDITAEKWPAKSHNDDLWTS